VFSVLWKTRAISREVVLMCNKALAQSLLEQIPPSLLEQQLPV
jgi:hypothetical protein